MVDSGLKIPAEIEKMIEDLNTADKLDPTDQSLGDETAQAMISNQDSVANHLHFLENNGRETGDYLATYGLYAENRLGQSTPETGMMTPNM